MARQESDREDLLREATALVARAELAIPHVCPNDNVVAGFRPGGAASIYVGPDHVYHFNTSGQLRRAYVDGELIKAVRGRLVAMRRQRSDAEVQLRSRDLSDVQQRKLLAEAMDHLKKLRSELQAGRYTLVGQVPKDANVVERLIAWIDGLAHLAVANRPNVS